MPKSKAILPTIVFVSICGTWGYHVATANLFSVLHASFWVLSTLWLAMGMIGYIVLNEDSEVDLSFNRLFFWSGAVGITAYIVGSWMQG